MRTLNGMLTKVSRLTSKGQATIPSAIRKQLHLESGDRIAFKVVEGRVEITRAEPIDIEFMQSQESNLATEWLADEDEVAYGNL
ncbi:MAG TPA: AbrB family transcriptional regulator [Opitutae bacterium]|jgi:AbrB family looped-hinge helix DNA binding protein|nr:AbrB family transcriptional regulator [Opitutae bacterium]